MDSTSSTNEHDASIDEERPSNADGTIDQGPHSSLLHIHDNAEEEKSDEMADEPKEKPRSVPVRGILWDILSLAVATASFIALAAVLRACENKPTPKWYLGITLNAIVSILSTIFKGTLLVSVASNISQFGWLWFTRPRPLRDVCDFDDASRGGPMGSIMLLYRLRFIHFASVGAIIMLAAMALDPFFQQTIRYVPKPTVDQNQQAQASISYNWGSGISVAGLANAYAAIPHDMEVAIQTGLISGDSLTLPVPPFNCPSGNCTWDPFSTLAVGVQCDDMTSDVKLNCTSYGCNYYAPSDSLLQEMINSTIWDEFIMESDDERHFLPAMQRYANVTGFLAMVQWVKANATDNSHEAGRCGFYLGVQEIQANVTNGRYAESVLQEWTYSDHETAPSDANEPDPTKIMPQTLNGTTYEVQTPDVGGPPNIYKPPFAQTEHSLQTDTFQVPYEAWSALVSQLTLAPNFLSGSINSFNIGNASDNALMLYNAKSVTNAMVMLAKYATNAMRANATALLQEQKQDTSLIAPENSVLGDVQVQTQFVVVTWPWLILPGALLVLSILFLLAAWWETRRVGVGMWESSPLALLFRAKLSERARGIVEGDLRTADAMKDASDTLRARISKDAGGVIDIYTNDRAP